MATKNKNIPKLEKTFLVTAVFLMLILLGYSLKPAASVIAIESDCNLSTDKEKCEELKKKAEDYQDIIEIKEKTEKTLESQLQILNTQQAKNEVELDKTKDKVDELSGKISELEQQIRSQEKQIDHQKTILSGLMQSYYADYQQGLLPIVLASQNFSDILSQSDYLAHSSLKVSDILAAI